jgi:hypothetical protein
VPKINDSNNVRFGKKPMRISPAFILIINHGKTMCEVPNIMWFMMTRDLKKQ